MAKLYYGKIAIVSVTATEAASGYPASNMALESLGRPWRSTTTGADTIVFDLGSSLAIDSLFLHDVNFATAAVSWSADNVTYSAPVTLTTYADRHGRRRGRVSVSATMRYVKAVISAGTPADGLAYWRIGAAYVFSSSVSPTAFPVFTYRVTTTRPRTSVALPNGITAAAATGINIDLLELTISKYQANGESADDFIQRAAAGSIVLDMAITDRSGSPIFQEQVWPMRCLAQQIQEDFPAPLYSTLAVPFLEIV